MSTISTTHPEVAVTIRMGEAGAAAYPAKTVVEIFQATVENHGSKNAMAQKKKVDGVLPDAWTFWTWQQYWDKCMAFAKTLVHLNVNMFKITNIIGFNSPEWFVANTGSIIAGCIAAGIYTTNLTDACMYITSHSKAEVLVVEDNKQLMKYAGRCGDLPDLKAIVVYGEAIKDSNRGAFTVPVYTFDEFLQLGSSVETSAVEARYLSIVPGNCSTLIYTSGTTGPPKAVMISHDNITWTAKCLLDNHIEMNSGDRIVSYLPLSHIAGQMIDIHAPMYLGACTYFAQPDALKGSLTATLKDCRPTLFFGVPRVWEKIEEKMKQLGRETTGVKKMLSTWAKGCGTEHSRRCQFGGDRGLPFGYGCANSIVLSKIKEALGLDQAKYCFSAAAPISHDTVEYFASLDIPIFEVFGQSECTGPHTVACPHQWIIGYCGRPMPGTETMIAEGTNELCYRGRHVFMGYMYMDDKTDETIDADGYLHSGDVAEFDKNEIPGFVGPSGFMRITGRIKDLIITAGGENIPPVLIENEMKSEMMALSNCLVVGDRQKFLTMLVSLKTEVNPETQEPTDVLTGDAVFIGNEIGSTATTLAQAAECPKWQKYITDHMNAVNARTTSNAQTIKKWKMLPVDLSEKAGDLTPTLKVKRNVVLEKYADLAASMYTGGGGD
jgi:long-chain-fatty-acid--CoA ligase ACSBG